MLNRLQEIDEIILFFIQEHLKNPVMDHVMVFFTSLGNAGFLWLFIAILLLFSKRYQKCSVYLLTAIFFAMFFGDEVLKPLIGRMRPISKFPTIELLIKSPGSFSFPSGHAMVGFASATVLYYCNRRFGLIAYVIASLIAFSRIYLFVHYPSDTLGGIVFGVLTAIFTIHILNLIYTGIEKFNAKYLR